MSKFPNQPAFAEDGETVVSAADWLGNRFGIGDVVVYAIGAGRGQMLAVGKVLKFKIDEHSKTRWDYSTRPSTRVPLPVEEWVVEVQVLTEFTSGNWDNKKRTRPAWVNSMNVSAVSGFDAAVFQKIVEAG